MKSMLIKDADFTATAIAKLLSGRSIDQIHAILQQSSQVLAQMDEDWARVLVDVC